MSNREIIKDFYGRILGSVTTDAQGNKVVRDFYGKILGRYDKKSNVTKDFYGRIVSKGDHSASLIPMQRTLRQVEKK